MSACYFSPWFSPPNFLNVQPSQWIDWYYLWPFRRSGHRWSGDEHWNGINKAGITPKQYIYWGITKNRMTTKLSLCKSSGHLVARFRLRCSVLFIPVIYFFFTHPALFAFMSISATHIILTKQWQFGHFNSISICSFGNTEISKALFPHLGHFILFFIRPPPCNWTYLSTSFLFITNRFNVE